jgi:hypothetical protein
MCRCLVMTLRPCVTRAPDLWGLYARELVAVAALSLDGRPLPDRPDDRHSGDRVLQMV